ncbi:uncharacterized protein G2W53_022308 [Senna tora]|uniref:Uncharacterized protein n=1 Tax=Senna tora TaxID=362788 RepID=A0A834WP21_9FABA|nr:uncharacterized protein G2W53_022308 [Senna tora]
MDSDFSFKPPILNVGCLRRLKWRLWTCWVLQATGCRCKGVQVYSVLGGTQCNRLVYSVTWVLGTMTALLVLRRDGWRFFGFACPSEGRWCPVRAVHRAAGPSFRIDLAWSVRCCMVRPPPVHHFSSVRFFVVRSVQSCPPLDPYAGACSGSQVAIWIVKFDSVVLVGGEVEGGSEGYHASFGLTCHWIDFDFAQPLAMVFHRSFGLSIACSGFLTLFRPFYCSIRWFLSSFRCSFGRSVARSVGLRHPSANLLAIPLLDPLVSVVLFTILSAVSSLDQLVSIVRHPSAALSAFLSSIRRSFGHSITRSIGFHRTSVVLSAIPSLPSRLVDVMILLMYLERVISLLVRNEPVGFFIHVPPLGRFLHLEVDYRGGSPGTQCDYLVAFQSVPFGGAPVNYSAYLDLCQGLSAWWCLDFGLGGTDDGTLSLPSSSCGVVYCPSLCSPFCSYYVVPSTAIP